MLIQLEIESLIKQIQRDSDKSSQQKCKRQQPAVQKQSQDDQMSTSSSLLIRTKSHITTGHQYLKDFTQKMFKQTDKISHISSDTFLSDKLIRLIGSIIKVLRVFQLVKNPKVYQKLSFQIVQLRRLLRYNRFLSYFREIKHLLFKQNKKWLDYYNIIFKNLQFFLDLNDTLSYFQQMKLISNKTFKPQTLKKNVGNLYFIECLMWLYLNSYDYIRNKKHRSRKQNLKKQLVISKYLLDSFTSHNQFSPRWHTFSPKLITVVGTVSSVVGLVVLWV